MDTHDQIDQLPTPENWLDYASENFSDMSDLSYIKATKDISHHLALLMDNAQSLSVNELRQQISDFIRGREDLVKFANWNSPF